MTFGDPIIYYCPSCNKPMKMRARRSYTVRSSDVFSDGYSTGRPHFTPDLAKCPNCKKLFFRHNVKNTKEMDRRAADKIKDIENPERNDLLNALSTVKLPAKNKTIGNRQEEKTLREDLCRNLNNETRRGDNILSGELLETWKINLLNLKSFMETERTRFSAAAPISLFCYMQFMISSKI